MTLKRRVEEVDDEGRRREIVDEVDEEGRRRTVVTEEPMYDKPSRFDDLQYRDTEVVGEEEVVHARPGPSTLARRWLRALGLWTGLAMGVVEGLLGFRLGFQVAGANPNNDFVVFIYDLTGPMVDPFEGIASARSVDGGVFEPATVIAMVVFFAATLVLVAMLWAITVAPSRAESGTTTRSQRRMRAVRKS